MNFSEDDQVLLQSPIFQAWKEELEASGCRLSHTEALKLVLRKDGSMLFGLIKAQARDPDNNPLLPIALLRGAATVVVPVFRNQSTGQVRFLMVLQRRIGNGHDSLEFPAGMLDENVNQPQEVAVKEMKEETGVVASPSELVCLCEKPLYSSPGLCDEAIYYYALEREISDMEWNEMDGRLGGNANENERIRLCWKTVAQAREETTSLQVRAAIFLFLEKFPHYRNMG